MGTRTWTVAACVMLAAGTVAAAEPVAREVEQKRAMIERLAQARGNAAALAKVDEAGAALAGGDAARADAALNAAVRLMAGPARPPTTAELKGRHQELLQQLAQYRGALAEAVRAKTAAADQLNQLEVSARAAAAAGRLDDANRLLADALQVAEATVSQARDGEVAVVALSFDSPADEFRYEQERHRSYLILVGQALDASGTDAALADRMRTLRGEGGHLAAQADSTAAGQDFPRAIAQMEAANRALVRALQAFGLPIAD